MKTFELSSKQSKNGRRKFKAILYEIFPDSCINEKEQAGTQFNENGITWIKEYCENALPSIKGMSLKCEFLDDERTELCGHGETETNSEDGLPVFENAVVIGTFDKGYIEDIEMPNGETKTVCIGEGTVDGLCYHNFCKKLDEDIKNGDAPSGSVEILKTGDNDGIVYKYGFKERGRIPTIFEHSGYALLGVRPADQTAKILELNSKEDLNKMTDIEIKALVSQTVEELSAHTVEINKCKEEYNQKLAEANEMVDAVTAEKEEAIANSEKIQTALDECRVELEETHKKLSALYEEMDELREQLGKAKAKERVGELNAAIADFSDDEKSYAQAEIDAFNADPIKSEINSVVTKIWEGIGKKAKTDATVAAEQNAAKTNVEDIFAEVSTNIPASEDVNIF